MEISTDVEAGQRRLLRRNRALATGLLVFAAVSFLALRIVPREPGFWLLLLRSMAEAAIAGALADWFAITALFRRPLGLPIPHTAIVPRNKDRIGQGLGSFVERNFLDPALVGAKLRSLDPASKLAGFLAAPGRAEDIAERVVAVLPGLIQSFEDRELRDFFGRALGEQLRDIEVSPLLGRGIELIVRSGQHQVLVERIVAAGIGFIDRNETRLEEAVAEKSRWWVPKTFDRKLARAIADGVREVLLALRDPHSEPRIRFELALGDLAADLQSSPRTRAQIEGAKLRLLEGPEAQAMLGTLWDEIRRVVLADLADPKSKTRVAIATGLRSVGATLAADPAVRARLNETVERMAAEIVVPWRRGIGRFIAEVVHSWDTKTVTDRLELAVGSDLQYVRISGTLVASLVGAALFLVSWMVE